MDARFRDQEVIDQKLVLSNDKVNFLGPNLVLKNCELIIETGARGLVLVGPRLIDCTIRVKRKLVNHRWLHAYLEGCMFLGQYVGNDFGDFRRLYNYAGSVERCDFSRASIHLSRFFGCDAESLHLPSWPFFTVIKPFENKEALLSRKWPSELANLVQVLIQQPSEVAALSCSASEVLGSEGDSELELKSALASFDFIRM